MLPISFQTKSPSERKEIVLQVAREFSGIDPLSFPKIYNQLKSGNSSKVALLNRIITQMFSSDFDVKTSLVAVEGNI